MRTYGTGQDGVTYPSDSSYVSPFASRNCNSALVWGLRQGTQIRDNRLRIGMAHVIDVHRWAQGLALGTCPLFKDTFSLLVGHARKARQSRSAVRPISDVLHGHDPDWRSLQPSVAIQLTLGVPRGMTLGAFCHLFDKIPAAFDFACVRRARARLCWTR